MLIKYDIDIFYAEHDSLTHSLWSLVHGTLCSTLHIIKF